MATGGDDNVVHGDGAMGNKVDDDGNGATGDDNDDDNDGDDNDNRDGNSVMGSGMTRFKNNKDGDERQRQ